MNMMKFFKSQGKKLAIIAGVGIAGAASISFADDYFEISKNLDIFTGVYKEVHTNYVDEVEPGKLMRIGIDAMLESLDPYTSFYSEAETEDYRFQITGQYGGIGAVISQQGDWVIINEPYEGFPAAKADLRPGDKLIEADGKSLKGMNTSDVSKVLKGAPNTDVKVIIERYGEKMEKTITREKIHVNNVPYYGLVNDKIGYISLQGFRQQAGNEVRKALEDLKSKHDIEGVILDLRGNPGGLLHEAINVVNVFVPRNQLVVSTKGKVKSNDRNYKTLNEPVDTEIPVIVLTNSRSASASEIVSGTIQDLDRGVVLGERTFGKGLVQTTRPLKYGTQVKITTQKYYTPSGRCIQALDYSNRNEDGSVGTIPDSLKQKFKTRNGRSVYDGGGIEPDVKVEKDPLSKIAISLLRKQLIFEYAVHFRKSHETIAPAREFELSDADWNDFLEFIKDKDYAYQTETEAELEQMAAKAKKEGYYDAIKDNYEAMMKSLKHDKESDVSKRRKEISRLITEEIVRHYYYRTGGFEIGFRQDEDIQKAVELMNSPSERKEILKP